MIGPSVGRLVPHGLGNDVLGLMTRVDALRCRYGPSGRPRVPPRVDAAALLVIRIEAKLGDALLHVPFLRELRRRNPEAAIHLVHHRAVREVYAGCPYVDRRVEIDWNASSLRSLPSRLSLCRAAALELPADAAYRCAYATRWDEDLYGTFLLWFSGAAQRVAFASDCNPRRAVRNRGSDRLSTRVVLDRSARHESERSFRLLDPAAESASTALEFWWSAEDRASATAMLSAAGVASPYLVIAPGAAGARRRWPLEAFAEFVRRLRVASTIGVVVLGSQAESAECATLCEQAGLPLARNFAGRLSLGGCSALLRGASLFVGNDSGLLHLACACGTPAVQISCHPLGGDPNHPNSPRRFGPTGPGAVSVQPPRPAAPACAQGCVSEAAHCIRLVDVESVVSAALAAVAAPDLS